MEFFLVVTIWWNAQKVESYMHFGPFTQHECESNELMDELIDANVQQTTKGEAVLLYPVGCYTAEQIFEDQ